MNRTIARTLVAGVGAAALMAPAAQSLASTEGPIGPPIQRQVATVALRPNAVHTAPNNHSLPPVRPVVGTTGGVTILPVPTAGTWWRHGDSTILPVPTAGTWWRHGNSTLPVPTVGTKLARGGATILPVPTAGTMLPKPKATLSHRIARVAQIAKVSVKPRMASVSQKPTKVTVKPSTASVSQRPAKVIRHSRSVATHSANLLPVIVPKVTAAPGQSSAIA